MALITFNVTGATIGSRLEHGQADWHVSFNLVLPFEESIKLATGEDAGTIRLALTVKATTPDIERCLQEDHNTPGEIVIGRMHYFDGPPTILSDANIPTEAFLRLMQLVEQGRIPKSLTVEVQGMTYDWQPDGSGKVWDNREKPILGLAALNFDVPVAAPAANDEQQHRSQLTTLVRELVALQKVMLGALIVVVAILERVVI